MPRSSISCHQRWKDAAGEAHVVEQGVKPSGSEARCTAAGGVVGTWFCGPDGRSRRWGRG